MSRSLGTVVLAMSLALSGCQCGVSEELPEEDAGVVDGGRPPRRDAGVDPVDVPDASWPTLYASEPCGEDIFPGADGGQWMKVDGGFRMGICIKLSTLTAEVTLDGQPETKPVITRFTGGGYESELTRAPDQHGNLQVKVMRGRYDILRHQPGGVWPYFEGFIEHGFCDMTKDQDRRFDARSHLVRGAVRFGGLPFVPNAFPQDVWFNAYGSPPWQMSMVTSNGGSYELRMLEGLFGIFISTPATSLYGTELREFSLTPGAAMNLVQDTEFDVDIPTSVLEAEITMDGQPLPDARVGSDYKLRFTKPGETTSSVFSHQEGGVSRVSALVPKATYGVTLDFEGAPNRTYPSSIFGKQIQGGVDLRNDVSLSIDFLTKPIEGGILIDGRPPLPNPAYNFQLFMYSMANSTQTGAYNLYEVPMESASFELKAFPGLYFVALGLDEGLSPNLAGGFYVVDRFFEHYGASTMAINIDTARVNGKISIDGQPPVPGRRVGQFVFRNRALEGQWSWFYASVVPGDDGAFEVRLPRGEYEVFFSIDNETYPTYASGRLQVAARLSLQEDSEFNLDYRTVEVSGPLRVGGETVRDTLGTPEVGLRLQRQQDFQIYEWNFNGGQDTYVLRVPEGSYAVDFVVRENAIDGVAWGNAPMGLKLNMVPTLGEPFMNFVR